MASTVSLLFAELKRRKVVSGETGSGNIPEGLPAESVGSWTPGRTVVSLVVLAGILLGGWFVFGRDRGPDLVAERVVVAPFRNLTAVDSLDVVGDMASYWLSDDLKRAGGVDVVPADVAIEYSSLLAEGGPEDQ